MSKHWAVTSAVVAVALVLWSALSGDTFPLVLLAAGGLVVTLVALGPSDSRPDPRDTQAAAEHVARQPRHTDGLF